ncbi:YlaN family protein [Paenibacillus sp. y28]|uniref:YlaN family protein n=1 Tax=Paenibacillus sp. y28 TaxID=3129110 RepID=UPI00301919C9
MSSSELSVDLAAKAYNLLQEDANKIAKLIEVQMDTLTNRRCPLYEEVLDTQMYGLSREIDFAVRAGLIVESDGKAILAALERNLAKLYEALNYKKEQQS